MCIERLLELQSESKFHLFFLYLFPLQGRMVTTTSLLDYDTFTKKSIKNWKNG